MLVKKTTFYLLLSLFILSVGSIYAQGSGRITGTVTDSTTGEALFGANVYLEGQSLGAATDFGGEYRIAAVPAGSYTLVFRYIGYQDQTIPINVESGKTLVVDIALLSQVIEGEEVTVTAQALGQKQAINQQISANTIKNIVSSEKIQELPDESAAAALSRLPGVSIEGGDKIVVRGIQAKMNKILVNGIELPSTDMNDRSTNLGFVSSNMLSGIEVTKALTPDMDANAIGGVVNLKLREAAPGWGLDVLAEGGTNTQDATWDNYKFWGSLSNRFFNDKLGVFVQLNAKRSDEGDDVASASWEGAAEGDKGYGISPYIMNDFAFIDGENIISNYGGSVILDYKLTNGSIIFQNTLAYTENDIANYRTEYLFFENQVRFGLQRDKHNKKLLINALQAEYNFGDIKTELTLSHQFSDKNTDLRYGDPGNFFGFVGTAPFGYNSQQAAISYNAGRRYYTPEDVYALELDPTYWERAKISGWAITREEEFKQHLYNASLDFTVPVSFSPAVSSEFKFGGKFTRSTRVNDVQGGYNGVGQDDFYNNVSDFIPGKTLSSSNAMTFADIRNNDYDRGDHFLSGDYDFEYAIDKERFDEFLPKAKAGWNTPSHEGNSLRDDYHGDEEYAAGYVMGTFNIGSKLTLIGGARYEHYNMDYGANFIFITHSVYGDTEEYDTLNTVNRSDDDFFPNFQLRYKITDWVDVRFAYSKAISRPDYIAILPRVIYDDSGNLEVGNTALKPTISNNYDVSFSFYNNQIGLFTVGGFYKTLDDIFYRTAVTYPVADDYGITVPDTAAWTSNAVGLQLNNVPDKNSIVTSYVNNPNPAHLKGLEFDWQTNFWYLTKPFNALVFNINYTRIWSDMDYKVIRNKRILRQDGPITYEEIVTVDTIKSARLLYQGDHILNASLGIDYKGFSGRISFNMQGDVITSVGLRPEADEFTGNIYKWDLMLQQKLGEHLSIALNGINVFHNPVKTYRHFPREEGGEILENLTSTTYSPRKFQLNVRYRL